MARSASASRVPDNPSPTGCSCLRSRPTSRMMTARPVETSAGPRASAAQWAGAPERGSATLLKIMIFLALRCGRPVAHRILHVIAAYFFAFAPGARRSAREYLRRALGREPGAIDRYRQVFAFASTILDRLYLVRERHGLFEISTEGEELMHDMVARGNGAFLLGAHLGSFEIMSALGRRRPGLRVAMAMYEHNASRVAAFFKAAGNPASAPEIIALGHLEAMLRLRDCLDEGKFVGMLADRTIADAPARMGPEGNNAARPRKFTICAGASAMVRSASMPTNLPSSRQSRRRSIASRCPSAMISGALAGLAALKNAASRLAWC